MSEAEDMQELVGAPDVVDPAPALAHRPQHQHVGAGALQVPWWDVSYVKTNLHISELIRQTYWEWPQRY